LPDDNLENLIAELRAIEWWDRATQKAGPADEFDRAGFRARQSRRREIIDEIAILMNKADRDSDRIQRGIPMCQGRSQAALPKNCSKTQ
jgi:hypothetical protein